MVLLAGGMAGTVLVASAASQPSVSGSITQVGSGSITVQPKSGDPVAVTLNDATVVKVLGKVATAADLKVGMTAIVIGPAGQPATEIRAYPPPTTSPSPSPTPKPYVYGNITEAGAASITVQPPTGQAVVVPLNDATVVKIGAQVGKIADLKAGMRCYVFGQPGQPATQVAAYTPPAPK
jgi:Ethanolamine utilization protein EutJ (predicted chaperonin)